MFNFLFSAKERLPGGVENLLGEDKQQEKREHRHSGELGGTPPPKIPRCTPSSWDLNSELRISALIA